RQPLARQRLRIILLTGRRVRSGGVNGRYVPVNQTVRTHTACIWVDLDDQARRLVRTFEGLVVLKFAVSKKPVAHRNLKLHRNLRAARRSAYRYTLAGVGRGTPPI